jgi:hypothetical protein
MVVVRIARSDYFVADGAGEAAGLAAALAGAALAAAGGGGGGVAKTPANCGSFTTIVAFC